MPCCPDGLFCRPPPGSSVDVYSLQEGGGTEGSTYITHIGVSSGDLLRCMLSHSGYNLQVKDHELDAFFLEWCFLSWPLAQLIVSLAD
jgi:hypothetical protein